MGRTLQLALLAVLACAPAAAAQRPEYLEPEQQPLCSADFCVHYVDSGIDAATPEMAERTFAEAAKTHDFETGTLGWREPPDDGDGRVDIYLKELRGANTNGITIRDGSDPRTQPSYMVIDNDMAPDQTGGADPLEYLRTLLAHEYSHVLQRGYDVKSDPWHDESSAEWMEQRMYPEINHWVGCVDSWVTLTELPLTAFDEPEDPDNCHPYGSVVWNQFLSETYGTEGDALHRATWEKSNGAKAPSTAAYDAAIRSVGGPGIAADFATFAAAVAEWRTPRAPFPTPSGGLLDVERRGALKIDRRPVSVSMDHLTFALYDVPATTVAPIRLAASFPTGMSAAIALVARSGSVDGGKVSTTLLPLPTGGVGGVSIKQPAKFYKSGGRITAVLINSDTTHGERSDKKYDWRWLRDDQTVQARMTSDTRGPRASLTGFSLRSRDNDRLTWTATLRQNGRTIGSRSGSIGAGRKRNLRIRGGEAGRARLVVVLTDPQGYRTRISRPVRLAP